MRSYAAKVSERERERGRGMEKFWQAVQDLVDLLAEGDEPAGTTFLADRRA